MVMAYAHHLARQMVMRWFAMGRPYRYADALRACLRVAHRRARA